MSNDLHVVVGAGPVGSAVAEILAAQGHRVRVVTRSGSGPESPQVERVRADAADSARLSELASGSVALYNCVNPPYSRWTQDWPPVAQALLAAAESSGAVLAMADNLYAYGRVTAPMTEQTPLAGSYPKAMVRKQMWLDGLAAHEAGRVRFTSARGADYVGPRAQSHLGDRVAPRLLAGKSVQVLDSPDTPHTWTYTRDMARTLVAIAADERAWGRAWHVPSNAPRTQREAIGDMARIAGVEPVKVSTVPAFVLRAMGLFSPLVRELPDVAYQLSEPFVMDSAAAQTELGLAPTPWDDVLTAHLDSYRTTAPAR
jgi:nucleoside-diphosphate-sugar epimerase